MTHKRHRKTQSRKYYEDNYDRLKGQRFKDRHKKKKYREEYKRKFPERYYYNKARGRARDFGIPFNIEISDIYIPEVCPVLGIKLKMNKKHNGIDSPSIDRINPKLGYVKGNVRIISHRANTLKSDATFKEAELIYKDMKRLAKKT